MKKTLFGILIIVVVGVIAAPFCNGLMAEKVLRSQLDEYNDRYADQPFYPQLEITRYDRDFGSSEIEWTITIPQLQTADDFPPIVLIEKAKHGYMGVTSTTSLDRNDWYVDFIREELDGNDPLSIVSQYNFLSGVTTTATLAAFELLDNENNRVSIKPAKLVIQTDRSFENFLTEANLEGISFAEQVDIEGIELRSDVKRISSFIMDGESSFSARNINFKDGDKGKDVAISSLKALSKIDFDETSEKLSMSTGYSIDQIVADEEKINDIRVEIGINQLDAKGLENIYKIYMDMMGDIMANLATAQNDPGQSKAMLEQQMALMGMRLVPEIEKLLKEKLQVKIVGLHLGLPQGEVLGDLTIGLKKDMTMAGFMPLTQQPAKLTEVFSFASNMTLPAGLVPNQDRLLVPVLPGMQSGMFEKVGEKLVHKAEIKDDKLFLNNKEFVLSSY